MHNENLFRNAADPYTIPLTDEPYFLRRDMLKQVTDIRVQKKREWKYPKLKFISCKKGVLKLLNSHQDKSYEMIVVVQPDKLQVCCSCGLETETICHHVYNALDSLLFLGYTNFFRDYQQNGLVETANTHPRYFIINETTRSLEITPHPAINPVYRFSSKVNLDDFNTVASLPVLVQSPLILMKGSALIYILVDAYRDIHPPFLLPCIGHLNKAGTEVKYFEHFISGTEKKYDAYLSDEQRTLNRICYEMWQLADKMNGSFYKDSVPETEKFDALLKLWQQAFPLLQQESFIYQYSLYWKKELKRKPSRQRIDRIEIKAERPLLRFLLLDRGDILQLKLQVLIKQRPLENFSLDYLFFVRKQDDFFLFSSLLDAGIAEWFNKSDNCITIFKEHYEEFEKDFLSQLKKNYVIETIAAPPLKLKKINAKK